MKMITSIAALVAIAITMFAVDSASAQDSQRLFGGVGIPNLAPEPVRPGFELPKLFSRGNNNNRSGTPATPAINWPEINLFNRNGGSGGAGSLLGGITPLLQRDPNKPKLLDEFNQKTKDFFAEKTDAASDWARNQSEQFRSRTSRAWNSLTGGLAPQGLNSAPPVAQPPVRSAELTSGQDRVRF